MKTPIAWASAILTLFVAVTIVLLLESQAPENTPEAPETSPEVKDSSTEEPKHAVGIQVELPIEKLSGQFVILENREWSYKEIKEYGWIPDRFSRTWGAGRLVKEGTTVVSLSGAQTLGYIPAGWLADYEINALEGMPEVTALEVNLDWRYSEEDIQRAISLPTLTCLATTSGVLDKHPLPSNIFGLTVNGAPTEWNFPWVTSFESNTDYFSDYGADEIPTPLPTNLDNVELLIIGGWPGGEPLPPSVRRLNVGHLEPRSLVGATNLEWIEDAYFEMSDDNSCLEVFASFPWLNEIELSNGRVTDADLKALSTAKHIETLNLEIDWDSKVTSQGIAALAYMPNLRSLTISGGVTDEMCLGLAGAPALEELIFGSQSFRIRGAFMEVLASLPKLEILNMYGCERFTGDGVRFLSGLKIKIRYRFTEYLTTKGCQEVIANWPSSSLRFSWSCKHLTDEAFEGLENAHRLRSLYLNYLDGITGKTLNKVLSLDNLEGLALSDGPGLTDEFVFALSKMKNLKKLDISCASRTSEPALLEVLKLPQLESLGIVGDSVTVNFLQEVQHCQSLKSLKLDTFYQTSYQSKELDPRYDAVWALIDARPDLKVFAREFKGGGNPYAWSKHPNRRK
ncbi:MAG: hypothetical protein L3J82_00430 [Planctomycetes bacterium]|nr:hypothetical protein [Planctomycetota bacterium]